MSSFLISEMHETAASAVGVGGRVMRGGRWGCFLAACPVGRCCTGLGKQKDKARQARG